MEGFSLIFLRHFGCVCPLLSFFPPSSFSSTPSNWKEEGGGLIKICTNNQMEFCRKRGHKYVILCVQHHSSCLSPLLRRFLGLQLQMALGSTLPNWPLPFPYLGHSNIEKRIQKMKCTIPLRIQKSWASAHHFMGLPLAALPLPLDHQQQGRRIFSAHLVNKIALLFSASAHFR